MKITRISFLAAKMRVHAVFRSAIVPSEAHKQTQEKIHIGILVGCRCHRRHSFIPHHFKVELELLYCQESCCGEGLKGLVNIFAFSKGLCTSPVFILRDVIKCNFPPISIGRNYYFGFDGFGHSFGEK